MRDDDRTPEDILFLEEGAEVDLVEGLTREEGIRLLRRSVVIRGCHRQLPRFYVPLEPAALGLPAEVATAVKRVTKNGHLRLFPEDKINELSRPVTAIQKWLDENTSQSVFGRLVLSTQWAPRDYEQPDWGESKQTPGVNNTWREVWDYNLYRFRQAVEDAYTNHQTYVAQVRTEVEPLARGIYRQIVAVIGQNPEAYPGYAVQTTDEGNVIPVIAGKAMSENDFVAYHWTVVQSELPKQADFQFGEGCLLRYDHGPVPIAVVAPDDDIKAFADDLCYSVIAPAEVINEVALSVRRKMHEFTAQTAQGLLDRMEENDGALTAPSVGRLGILFRNIRRLNILQDYVLDQACNELEEIYDTPFQERDWAQLGRILHQLITRAETILQSEEHPTNEPPVEKEVPIKEDSLEDLNNIVKELDPGPDINEALEEMWDENPSTLEHETVYTPQYEPPVVEEQTTKDKPPVEEEKEVSTSTESDEIVIDISHLPPHLQGIVPSTFRR